MQGGSAVRCRDELASTEPHLVSTLRASAPEAQFFGDRCSFNASLLDSETDHDSVMGLRLEHESQEIPAMQSRIVRHICRSFCSAPVPERSRETLPSCTAEQVRLNDLVAFLHARSRRANERPAHGGE